MDPYQMFRVPFHTLVHTQDELAVLSQALEAFGPSPFVIEVAQWLAGERDDLKGFAFKFEFFTWVGGDAVATLVSLDARKG